MVVDDWTMIVAARDDVNLILHTQHGVPFEEYHSPLTS